MHHHSAYFKFHSLIFILSLSSISFAKISDIEKWGRRHKELKKTKMIRGNTILCRCRCNVVSWQLAADPNNSPEAWRKKYRSSYSILFYSLPIAIFWWTRSLSREEPRRDAIYYYSHKCNKCFFLYIVNKAFYVHVSMKVWSKFLRLSVYPSPNTVPNSQSK